MNKFRNFNADFETLMRTQTVKGKATGIKYLGCMGRYCPDPCVCRISKM